MWPAERRSEELEFATEYRASVADKVREWMQTDPTAQKEQEMSRAYETYGVFPRRIIGDSSTYANALSQQISSLILFLEDPIKYENKLRQSLMTSALQWKVSASNNNEIFSEMIRSNNWETMDNDSLIALLNRLKKVIT